MMPAEFSDDATGLPPIDQLTGEEVLYGAVFSVTEGIASINGKTTAARFLHVRGFAAAMAETNGTEATTLVDWAQVHIAIPTTDAMSVAAALAKGTDQL